MLMKSSTQSLTEQLSTRFAERIRNRLMAPGARLPSVRQCAQQHGVSPSTVVAAYDQLLAQGLVEARKNRGFFVRESGRAVEAADGDLDTRARPDDLALESAAANWSTAHWFAARAAGRAGPGVSPVNATALIRGMFHKISDKPQPGMGVFPPDWLESTFMPAAVRKVTNSRALQEFRCSMASRWAMQACGACWPKSCPRSTCTRCLRTSSPPWGPRMRWTS